MQHDKGNMLLMSSGAQGSAAATVLVLEVIGACGGRGDCGDVVVVALVVEVLLLLLFVVVAVAAAAVAAAVVVVAFVVIVVGVGHIIRQTAKPIISTGEHKQTNTPLASSTRD